MMEKLMVDSLVTWARDYKVDGFRFDLMGHHFVSNMEAVQAALQGLTVPWDGVDGKSIYLYGEGWDFGEVAGNARGENATQLNVGGLGIGTFNDRLRDAARGGTPFSGLQEQGFVTGLFTDPNGSAQGTEEEQHRRLLQGTDQIRIGLAGNLAGYTFQNAAGETVRGDDVLYGEAPSRLHPGPTGKHLSTSRRTTTKLFSTPSR
jgi:pullulanase/glycogen debranching enzyme